MTDVTHRSIVVPEIDPAEIAAQIVLLVSPRSGSTIGSDVLVDAGQVTTT